MLFFVLIVVSCASKVEEQKFVNPIFYKVMNPLSTGTWYTKITPTEMISSNKGDTIKENCTLTENTTNSVTLRCEGPDNKEFITLYQFVLIPESKNYDGMLVRMLYRSPDEPEKFTSQESLIIN